MRTNTSAPMTCFSDLEHEQVSLFPHHTNILAYLKRYANQFEIDRAVRLNCVVQSVDAASGGYEVRWREGNTAHTETFDNVVVASGRYQQPAIPAIPGLDSFRGDVCHSFQYKDVEGFRGKRVLVAGCAISALEIASDLATSGGAEVVSCGRRQRYVLPKIAAGVPTDQVLFNRFGAEALATFPIEISKANFQRTIEQLAGNPRQYGAGAPSSDVLTAGVTLCQNFLPLVAEGRISTKPWIREVSESRVTFEDGSNGRFDAILFGTGYKPIVPFLSAKISSLVGSESVGLTTSNLTFHPKLPNLAFVGMFGQIGPYFPVVELQARYVAAVWGGQVPVPAQQPTSRPQYLTTGDHIMHMSARTLSHAIAAEPNVTDLPDIAGALMFGPLPAISFRIAGPDALPHAAKRFAEVVAPQCSLRLTDEQRMKIAMLEKARKAPQSIAVGN